MTFYKFAVVALLALAFGQQSEAGLLDGVLGIVDSVANDVLKTVGQIALGGPNMQPDSKVVTMMTKDGKIIGHMRGDFVRIAEQIFQKNGATVLVRVGNNNSELQLLNTSGAIIFRFSGPKAQPLINFIQRYNGEILSTLNRLGNVNNGVQDVLDSNDNVVDSLTPSAVADNGGVVILAGKPLLGLIGSVKNLASGFKDALNVLSGKVLQGLNIDGDLDLIPNLIGGLTGSITGSLTDGLIGGQTGGLLGGLLS